MAVERLCESEGCGNKKWRGGSLCLNHAAEAKGQPKCCIENCSRPARTRGMCNSHYKRWWKYGDPLHVPEKIERKCSLPDCEEKHAANGYCQTHSDQLRRNGHPRKRHREVRGAKIRWLKAHINHDGDDCLIFPFKSYQTITLNGRPRRASNAMLRLAEGKPPTRKHECAHSCGNGHLGCVNPKHLRWATHQENMADQLEHGTRVRGEKHGMAKLTTSDVLEIRRLAKSRTHQAIADKFEISCSHVTGIVARKEWAWLK